MESYFGHSVGFAGWFVRAIQAVSAIVVLGITAWAVEGTKSVSVIYSLVVATLTLVVLVLAPGISCMTRRHRWHIFPLLLTDGVLSYLWLTSFIFLALDFNRTNCRRNRWNGEVNCSRSYTAEAFSFIAFFTSLLGFAFEIIFMYHAKFESVREMEEKDREEHVAENLNAAGLI